MNIHSNHSEEQTCLFTPCFILSVGTQLHHIISSQSTSSDTVRPAVN